MMWTWSMNVISVVIIIIKVSRHKMHIAIAMFISQLHFTSLSLAHWSFRVQVPKILSWDFQQKNRKFNPLKSELISWFKQTKEGEFMEWNGSHVKEI